jgi:hypothetical protein
MIMENAIKETKFWFACFYGKEARLNLLGQIVFSPFIVLIGLEVFVMEFLFTKRQSGEEEKTIW